MKATTRSRLSTKAISALLIVFALVIFVGGELATASSVPSAPVVTPPTPPDTNVPPRIITTTLATGTVNQAYSQSVVAIDRNIQDTLHLRADNLPTGLTLGSCATTVQNYRRVIRCFIVGVPQNAGEFPVRIVATDGQATTRKIYPLTISIN